MHRAWSTIAGLGLVVALVASAVVGAGPSSAQEASSQDLGGAVVGGQPSAPGAHPYQVAIVVDPGFWGGDPLLNQLCAGTLVAEDLVLTAAHCVEEVDFLEEIGVPIYGVLAGQEDLDAAVADDLIPVAAGALHPGYWYLGDDLALLELAEPVAGAQPIALPDVGDDAAWAAGAPATVLGWGDTSSDPTVPQFATTLQEAEVAVVDDAACAQQYRQGARLEIDVERTLCARGAGVSPCWGDSGGALVAEIGGEPVQLGIVQSGIACNDVYPALYVRLSRYAEQIRWVADRPFADVPISHPFVWEISSIAGSGVANGYPDGTYRPSRPVSRAAMAAHLYRLAGEPAVTVPTTPTFRDVRTGHPFFAEVEWLAAEGITTGYADGRFRPAAAVSRAAMAAYLHRFAGEPGPVREQWFADVGPGHPFFGEVGWAASVGIMQGSCCFGPNDEDVLFRPASPTSRQAMAAFLARLQELVL